MTAFILTCRQDRRNHLSISSNNHAADPNLFGLKKALTIYKMTGKAEIGNYSPLHTESYNVDLAGEYLLQHLNVRRVMVVLPTLTLTINLLDAWEITFPVTVTASPSTSAAHTPPRLLASLALWTPLDSPKLSFFYTAAPAYEEKSHTQRFQPFKSNRFDVQEVRQLGLTFSSGMWESILVLAGIELNWLCGA